MGVTFAWTVLAAKVTGVFAGSTKPSEHAVAEEILGELRRDPFVVLPFCAGPDRLLRLLAHHRWEQEGAAPAVATAGGAREPRE